MNLLSGIPAVFLVVGAFAVIGGCYWLIHIDR